MQVRIEQELNLLRRRFAKLEYVEEGSWIRIPSYSMPADWNRSSTDVVFAIPIGYPGTPPYGFYVPIGIQFKGSRPNNYTEPVSVQVPFEGGWGIFSWAPLDGHWRPTSDVSTGSNLLNWVLGLADRLREGL